MIINNNWDNHYNNKIRRILSIIGLKGNIVLNKQVAKFIIRNCNNLESCIEIGVGSGRLTYLLSKKFKKCWMLDKSKIALNFASNIAKNSIPIHSDIFDYKKSNMYDMVVSLGLVEHFKETNIYSLIDHHINLAKKNGCVLICVPSYNDEREKQIIQPKMVEKYGFQDAKCEYKINSYLKSKNFAFELFYLDKIPDYPFYNRLIKYINIISYGIFRINMELFYRTKRGDYAVFFFKKNNQVIND